MLVDSLGLAFGACSLLAGLSVQASTPRAATPAQAETPLETYSCLVLADEHAAIVTTEGGLVRRIDLDTRAATAEAREHLGNVRWMCVHQLKDGRVVTLDDTGLGYVRSRESLVPLAQVKTGPDIGHFAVHPSGARVARIQDRTRIAIGEAGAEPSEPVVLTFPSEVLDIEYSPDGERLAALLEDGYHLIEDGAPGELIPVRRDFDGAIIEFIGDERLAIGSRHQSVNAPVQVLIVDAKSGKEERVITAPYQIAPLSGHVSTLSYDPIDCRLTFGISSAGSIVVADPDSGELEWIVDFRGGNPAGIGLVHTRGSKRCFSTGMTDRHSAAFRWDTGERLTEGELHGFSYLGCTSDDEITVGVKDGQLTFVDSATYEPLWQRTEFAEPLAGRVQSITAAQATSSPR